jgi:hypothetical protein
MRRDDATCRKTAVGLNLLRGAPAIAAYLGPTFTTRMVHYIFERRKLKSIKQLGGSGPLVACPDELDREIRGTDTR